MRILFVLWIAWLVIGVLTSRKPAPPREEIRRPRVPDPAEHLLR